MLLVTRNELPMRLTEYTDEHGVKWITPARAAEIWNERAIKEYGKDEAHYTRWSVSQRKGLKTLILPGGRLYREDDIQKIPLRPHPPRKEKATIN